MAFIYDGFGGDGFSNLGQPEVDNPLEFVRSGQRVNVLVEVEVQPRLADRNEVFAESDPHADGLIGDGFSGINFLQNVETAPRLERFSLYPTNFRPTDPVLPNVTSRAVLKDTLRLKRRFDEAISGSSSELQVGQIPLIDSDYYVSEIAANTRVDGRPVRVYVLPDRGSADELVLLASARGSVWQTEQQVGRVNTATLKLADLSADLGSPIQREAFSGLGGLGGDPGLEGQWKPYLAGRRKNIEGILFDQANLLYMAHSGFSSFFEGRFGGEVAPYFGDFPSLEALKDIRKDIPEGSWATCRALGVYTPRPVGDGLVPFTFTVEAAGIDGVTKLGDVAISVLRNATDLTEEQIDTQGLQSLNVGDGGVWISGQQNPTVQSVLNDLARSAFGRITAGQRIGALLLRVGSSEAADRVIGADAIGTTLRRKRRANPAYKAFRVTYAPNDRVLNTSEVVVPEENQLFKLELQRSFETLDDIQGELTATEHRSAEELLVFETVLLDQSVAANVQQKLREYGQYERYVWECEFRSTQLDLELGARIDLRVEEHPAWRSGRRCLVVGVEPRFARGTVLVEFVDLGAIVEST